uniref:F-box associated beta-propeller type 1 domain-containing protein n=1 Tax=Fagus sylvatica TaxID=28930 RepID=A0A2N9G838_FAGSY
MSQPRRQPKLFSEFIPDDVVCDILTRFPVKSLIRFRFQIPFLYDSMVGFCNGLFCLFNRADSTLYLWNPCIKKFKMIATPRYSLKSKWHAIHHGFAYHSQNNDFKILQIIIYYPRRRDGTRLLMPPPPPPPPEASVYTLSTDYWRRVVIHKESSTRSVHSFPRPLLFFNGALHSLACIREYDFILCFDVNDEGFREIMIPRNYLDGFSPKTLGQLVVFKGSLALVCFGKDLNEESDICCIWVMREYGVVESWTRSTVPVNNVRRFFGSTDSDELLIETQDRQLVSFDPDSLNANSLGNSKS